MNKIRRCSIFIILFTLALCFSMPFPSAAVPGSNSYTGSISVPDQVVFTYTDDLDDTRIFHTATLLNNGMVLVAGGGSLPWLSSAELYNPTSDTWNTTGSMNIARGGHTATLLSSGKVLVVGGLNVGALSSAELYDPDTGIWSTTGSINVSRYYHTATLLNNGKVLIAGGYDGNSSLTSAELYDPDTGNWIITGSMSGARHYHTATLLENGKVLIAGGRPTYWTDTASAELYDPESNTWSNTNSMSGARFYHTATLMHNGKVLVAGTGYLSPSGINTAELYDPTYGTWTTAGDMNFLRVNHTATLLSNGKVLVVGGSGDSILASAEMYDPDTDTWETIGSMNIVRCCHKAILLNNGKVLVAGGLDYSVHYLASSELGSILDANTFTGTLTLPSDWINTTIISAQFVGTSSAAAINAGSLSNDNITWGDWISATPGEIVTTSWYMSGEGANKLVYLRLRDVNGQVATVVNGTVNLDLTKPWSTMTLLPPISPANISLSWSGSDTLSGVATYDVQVRAGLTGEWTVVLINTINTSTNYVGVNGVKYYFRTRASDFAGNVEDWPSDYDTFTIVGPLTDRVVFLPLITK